MQPTETGSVETEKVQRIRDLIFGQQMRDYSRRFDTVGAELAHLQQEINRLTNDLQEQMRRHAQQIQQAEDRLGGQLRALDERLTQQVQEGERRRERQTQELRQLVHELGDAVRHELHSAAAGLDERKADRFALGEFFVRLGASLKENHADLEAADLLEQLTRDVEMGESNSHG